MARRGGAVAQTFLPVAVVIAVLLFLGVVMLMVRSGRNPSGGGSSLAPATSSSTPAGSPSPSATPAPTPSAGAVAPSGTPSSGPAGAPTAGATARPGGAPPQAASPNNMPNTGPPFPWWMGLLPVSIGIGLAWALRPKASPMGAADGDGGPGGSAGAAAALARERRQVSRPRGRPDSALGKKRP
jgi:hypothetical protein